MSRKAESQPKKGFSIPAVLTIALKLSCTGLPLWRFRSRASQNQFFRSKLGDSHEAVGPAGHRAGGV
jgi:hypothetical protein